MASWTNLENLPLGTLITSNAWNVIFSPNGNMQYLKDIADKITFSYYYDFEFGYTTYLNRWPQGDASNVASTGTINYPLWLVGGIPQENRITLKGPAKYFGIMKVNVFINTTSVTYATVKTIFSDTSGNLNFTHISQTGYDTGINQQNYSYSIPFSIDSPFENDLMIGFVFQPNYETSFYLGTDIVDIGVSGKLMLYQTSAVFNSPLPATSFILNTSVLNGSSSI
jgi:hypothetical protein